MNERKMWVDNPAYMKANSVGFLIKTCPQVGHEASTAIRSTPGRDTRNRRKLTGELGLKAESLGVARIEKITENLTRAFVVVLAGDELANALEHLGHPDMMPASGDDIAAAHVPGTLTLDEKIKRCQSYVDTQPGISKGGRFDFAAKSVCPLGLDFDLDEDEFWPILVSWNNRNNPPVSEQELRRTLSFANERRDVARGCKLEQRDAPRVPFEPITEHDFRFSGIPIVVNGRTVTFGSRVVSAADVCRLAGWPNDTRVTYSAEGSSAKVLLTGHHTIDVVPGLVFNVGVEE